MKPVKTTTILNTLWDEHSLTFFKSVPDSSVSLDIGLRASRKMTSHGQRSPLCTMHNVGLTNPNKQTNGRYQTYYLPTWRSIKSHSAFSCTTSNNFSYKSAHSPFLAGVLILTRVHRPHSWRNMLLPLLYPCSRCSLPAPSPPALLPAWASRCFDINTSTQPSQLEKYVVICRNTLWMPSEMLFNVIPLS